MYKINWNIKYNLSIKDLINLANELKPDILSFDTETTGLHIVLDKPFYLALAIANTNTLEGISAGLYIDDIDINELNNCLIYIIQRVKTVLAFNTKFDLHMLYNVNIDLTNSNKLEDVAFYARLGLDALTTGKGGIALKLKTLAVKYISPEASSYEKALNELKKLIKVNRNTIIKKTTGIKIGDLNKLISDKTNELHEILDDEVLQILNDEQYNPNNYSNFDKEKLQIYANYDAIYNVELYMYFKPIVIERQQLKILQMENKLIPILWNMERAGFKLNTKYLLESKDNVRNYILNLRDELYRLTNVDFKINQHAIIKHIFSSSYNITLDKCDEDNLKEILKKNVSDKAKRVASIIIELRSLEKWYSTYIIKWLSYSTKTDTIYTSFNQVGAVSGRFSGDFQQFPRDPIYKSDGTELFSPRRIISVRNTEYPYLVLIDFASEELRFQALYTCLIGHPDLNLCRAFIPYKCKDKYGVEFKLGLSQTEITKRSPWYTLENNTEWHPTDIHDMTCMTAFPHIKKGTPEFKKHRSMAKATNFAKNYGASVNALIEQFGYSPELARTLSNAYDKAFPGVKRYSQYVYNILKNQNYITNLFGRRYYNASGHNCTNYLIQGSAADFLKLKLIELDEYFKKNNLKTRMLCTIHDEIVFEFHKDELYIIKNIEDIMQLLPNSPIPMVADSSISKTTWDKKEKFNYEDISN